MTVLTIVRHWSIQFNSYFNYILIYSMPYNIWFITFYIEVPWYKIETGNLPGFTFFANYNEQQKQFSMKREH